VPERAARRCGDAGLPAFVTKREGERVAARIVHRTFPRIEHTPRAARVVAHDERAATRGIVEDEMDLVPVAPGIVYRHRGSRRLDLRHAARDG
jgi:hypothetical protein